MAAITAQAVNDFRKRTGLGLMECKALLKEADGDEAKAETMAKERGVIKAAGRAGRATTAGRVEVLIAEDGRSGAIVELGCETDFVARNDAFRQAAKDLARHTLEVGGEGQDDLLSAKFTADPSRTVGEMLTELNSRTGENVQLNKAVKLDADVPCRVESYVHHDAKSGALILMTCPDSAAADSEAIRQLGKDLALHAVAARPLGIDRDAVPAEQVTEQRRIFETLIASQQGDKPENIRSKIAEGMINKWFAEQVLLEQDFVKDPSKKVREVISGTNKEVSVAKMVRCVVGEGQSEAKADPE